MKYLLVVALIFINLQIQQALAHQNSDQHNIDQIFHSGQLEKARSLAEELLENPNLAVDQKIALHLKLSLIHDRIGLHWNTRPVPEAMAHIEKAAALAKQASTLSIAQIELASANIHYRAAVINKKFEQAMNHAQNAREMFNQLKDLYGQADAIHQIGLIHLQLRELDQARHYFDLSLELEQQTDRPRAVMLADYERHVGFLFLFSDNKEGAIPYFQRSLKYRQEGGLKDAAMFAALSLVFTLVDLGRFDETQDPLDYALEVAEDINSPAGTASANYILGRINDVRGNLGQAREAYEKSLTAAKLINRTSHIERAAQAIERMKKTAQ